MVDLVSRFAGGRINKDRHHYLEPLKMKDPELSLLRLFGMVSGEPAILNEICSKGESALCLVPEVHLKQQAVRLLY